MNRLAEKDKELCDKLKIDEIDRSTIENPPLSEMFVGLWLDIKDRIVKIFARSRNYKPNEDLKFTIGFGTVTVTIVDLADKIMRYNASVVDQYIDNPEGVPSVIARRIEHDSETLLNLSKTAHNLYINEISKADTTTKALNILSRMLFTIRQTDSLFYPEFRKDAIEIVEMIVECRERINLFGDTNI